MGLDEEVWPPAIRAMLLLKPFVQQNLSQTAQIATKAMNGEHLMHELAYCKTLSKESYSVELIQFPRHTIGWLAMVYTQHHAALLLPSIASEI